MAAPPLHPVTPVPFPEGVASPDGATGFIELRDGGVRALDLATGRDLWSVSVPARPRLVVRDRLVAEDRLGSRGNALQLVTLDLDRQGVVDKRLDPIRLADWISVADPEQAFDYDLWAEGDDLLVGWRAESHYAGGAPPPAHVRAQASHQARGRSRVNLRTGSVDPETAGRAADARDPGDDTPAPRAADLPAEVARLVPAGAHSPGVVGGRLFYLVEPARRSDGGPRLVSVDLETGKQIWERTLPARPAAGPPARRM